MSWTTCVNGCGRRAIPTPSAMGMCFRCLHDHTYGDAWTPMDTSTRDLPVKRGRDTESLARRSDEKLTAWGLTRARWEEMLADQDGRCAICRQEFTSNPRLRPNVDHCHTTGEIRGLLCTSCNTGLGQFADDVERLQSAIRYLMSSGTGVMAPVRSKSRASRRPGDGKNWTLEEIARNQRIPSRTMRKIHEDGRGPVTSAIGGRVVVSDDDYLSWLAG